MNTKEKILSTALDLFNSDGLENVTTRHISAKLLISQGNLHYHYPTKNVIINVLFKAFLLEIKVSQKFKDISFKERIFLNSIKLNYEIMQKYSFIFKDKEIIWRRLPAIKIELISFLDAKKLKFVTLLNLYKSNGLLKKDVSNEQINFLADQFMFTISSWLLASEFMTTEKNKLTFFVNFTARLIIPYLENETALVWEELI